jgi:tetratricopeptide (TPR) repeat protein
MYRGDMDLITPRQLNEMAEFGDIPKTEHWHAGLARVMLNMRQYTLAKKHFQAALHINPNLRTSMVGLGRCLGALGRFEEALFWMNKVIRSILPSQQFLVEYILGYVAECKEKLGDVDGAVATCEERICRNPSETTPVYDYLWMLHRLRRYESILNFIRDIGWRETSIKGSTHSFLVELLSYGCDIGDPIGEAATIIGATAGSEVRDLMRKAIDDAVVIADNDPSNLWFSIRVRVDGGNFYSRHLNELDKSTVYWESAIQLISDHSNTLPYNFSYERKQCVYNLSEVFFQKAVEARKHGIDPGPWISRLQKMFGQPNSTVNKDDKLTVGDGKGYASQLYGIWLRDYESAEQRVWRAYFRASVLEGFRLIDDENDQHGYAFLALILLRTGDLDNGLAALSLTLNPLEHRQAREQKKARPQPNGMERRDTKSTVSATPEGDIPCESVVSKSETKPYS